MSTDSAESDETASPEPPVYDQIVRELNSGYKSTSTAAMKEITGVSMAQAVTSPALDDIVATVAVSADHQSPAYDTGSCTRMFELGLADIWRLAETAPLPYRAEFNGMAGKMTAQLQRDAAASRQKVLSWCDEGLPTNGPTTVRAPLRLTRRNGFKVTDG